MWDESLDSWYYNYQLQDLKAKYDYQLQELKAKNQINMLQNRIHSIDSNIEPFIVIYKKEMPKGGYFEGCTLELIGKNPKCNFNTI